MANKEAFAALAAPFPTKDIMWRVGSTNGAKTSGMALAYIDARDVMKRLDDVMGPAGWQCAYTHAEQKTVCSIGLLFETPNGHEWVWKADGAGNSDYEAEKGALSDAFKRAAVRWGIGRYLYYLDSPWVNVEAYGKSFKIQNEEYEKLNKIHERHIASLKTAAKVVEADPKTAKARELWALIDASKTAEAVAKIKADNAEFLASLVATAPDVERKLMAHLADKTKKLQVNPKQGE